MALSRRSPTRTRRARSTPHPGTHSSSTSGLPGRCARTTRLRVKVASNEYRVHLSRAMSDPDVVYPLPWRHQPATSMSGDGLSPAKRRPPLVTVTVGAGDGEAGGAVTVTVGVGCAAVTAGPGPAVVKRRQVRVETGSTRPQPPQPRAAPLRQESDRCQRAVRARNAPSSKSACQMHYDCSQPTPSPSRSKSYSSGPMTRTVPV
jgi:hypothetical protein